MVGPSLEDFPVTRRRDLLVANLLALVFLFTAVFAGWREAAAFGLAVLLLMDAAVILRQRAAHRSRKGQHEGE